MWEIAHYSRRVIPANRSTISMFLTSKIGICSLENVLFNLSSFAEGASQDWDTNVFFFKFKHHTLHTEQQLERRLEELRYYIDDSNALPVVAWGMPGKPEMVRP